MVRFTAEEIKISTSSVHSISNELLEMKEVSARWVLRTLTDAQKQTRLNIPQASLGLLRQDADNFWLYLQPQKSRGFTITILKQNRESLWLGKDHHPQPLINLRRVVLPERSWALLSGTVKDGHDRTYPLWSHCYGLFVRRTNKKLTCSQFTRIRSETFRNSNCNRMRRIGKRDGKWSGM
ncbi:hypothetical protein EVAR_53628_1 [Eumeta japonica]|uniref:Uncharacterized protein n=1 Tax=Eumeta variegata TaxID=151549 RepID=A0A4C1X2I8_EUMVA|nr:hypothetical protein EVAR_53628_1 [Eumeta japonica]